ncbi:MAG TPA: SHOCT domain-containing protein [Alphaproteobacteria bacterium]|nr:SHOCT domain-containing protein [Alphaproteobacteria bacterium]
MVSFTRCAAAACLAAIVSVSALAAEPLTGSRIKSFISSFTELKSFAEQRQIDFEKNQQERRQGQTFQPFSQGIGQLRAAGAYGEATRIVKRHGYSSMESWAAFADRILRAYIGLSMQSEQPRMAAGMAQARQMIMNNPNMTEQQKAQALASINASMRNVQQMQASNPADKAAVARYRPQLDAVFENDRAGRATQRGAHGNDRAPAMPQSQGNAAPAPGGKKQGIKARLSKLKELYDAGLISKQEYDAKRADILSQL